MPNEQRIKLNMWRRRTTSFQLLIWLCQFTGVALFVFCWQLVSDNTIWLFVADGDVGDEGTAVVESQEMKFAY